MTAGLSTARHLPWLPFDWTARLVMIRPIVCLADWPVPGRPAGQSVTIVLCYTQQTAGRLSDCGASTDFWLTVHDWAGQQLSFAASCASGLKFDVDISVNIWFELVYPFWRQHGGRNDRYLRRGIWRRRGSRELRFVLVCHWLNALLAKPRNASGMNSSATKPILPCRRVMGLARTSGQWYCWTSNGFPCGLPWPSKFHEKHLTGDKSITVRQLSCGK